MSESDSTLPIAGSYCSSCGFKFVIAGNFCPGCGGRRNENISGQSNGNSRVNQRQRKLFSSTWTLIPLLIIATGIGYAVFTGVTNNDSSNGLPQDYETNSDVSYDGMAEACDHVSIAISHHDPRYLTSRDSQSDIEIYKSEMQLAADILREESNYNPIAYELTKIAQQMHDGYRGIDEYGHFPLMEYCGV